MLVGMFMCDVSVEWFNTMRSDCCCCLFDPPSPLHMNPHLCLCSQIKTKTEEIKLSFVSRAKAYCEVFILGKQ